MEYNEIDLQNDWKNLSDDDKKKFNYYLTYKCSIVKNDDLIIDPKSETVNECKLCGCKDIRVHFSHAKKEDQLIWCVNCGSGTNSKRGVVDAFLFGSCFNQHKDYKNKK